MSFVIPSPVSRHLLQFVARLSGLPNGTTRKLLIEQITSIALSMASPLIKPCFSSISRFCTALSARLANSLATQPLVIQDQLVGSLSGYLSENFQVFSLRRVQKKFGNLKWGNFQKCILLMNIRKFCYVSPMACPACQCA